MTTHPLSKEYSPQSPENHRDLEPREIKRKDGQGRISPGSKDKVRRVVRGWERNRS
jgi:hypothetical protein